MGKFQAKKSHKKNWQKIQHPDVDKFLDDERQKEKYNFPSFEEFFSIDKGSAKTVVEEQSEPVSDKLVDFSKLKCFRLQKPHTAVPDPLIKRNKIKGNSNIKVRKSYRNIAKDETAALTDPWDESVPVKSTGVEGIASEWLSEDTLRVNSKIDKKPNRFKTSEIKAVEIPHPGFSINPTYGDHQDLLKRALEVETKAIKKEEKLKKATRVPRNAVYEDQSLIQGDNDDDEVDASDDDDDKKPILTKSKTKKQRRMEKSAKDAKLTLAEAKQAKTRESDVFNIKKFKKEIEKKEQGQKERLLKKIVKKQEASKFGQKTLSKWKFQQEKLNPLLSDELPTRMVEVRGSATSSILLDRFKSLQKRNILEVRVRQGSQKKNRRARFQRPGDKEEWEKTGVWNGIKIDTTRRKKRKHNA